MADLNIRQRIKMWAGTYADDQYMQEFVDRATENIIEDLPEKSLWPFYSEVTVPDGGLNVVGYKVVTPHKDGVRAKPIPFFERSKWVAVAADPIYYFSGTDLVIEPDGGQVVVVTPPTVSIDDTAIANTPRFFEDMVVFRAAIEAIAQSMADLRNDVTVGITLPTAPGALTAPSISYVDVTSASRAATTIDFTGITAPTFTKPTKSPSFTTYTADRGVGDIEQAQLELGRYQTELEEYMNEFQVEVGEFNSEVEAYRALVQKAIRQAELNQQRILETAQATDSVALQNEAQTLSAQIQQFTAQARKYELDYAGYSADIQALVAELQAKIDSTSQKLRMYQFDLNRMVERYQEAKQKYIRRNLRRIPLNPIYQDF